MSEPLLGEAATVRPEPAATAGDGRVGSEQFEIDSSGLDWSASSSDTPGTSDAISMSSGELVLSSQQFSDFNFTWTSNFGQGTFDLIAFTSRSGSLGQNTSGTIDALPASIAVRGDELVLNVVPEPSTATLLGAGVLGLIGWAWPRRLRKAQGRVQKEMTNV